jgi:hypothetical protein
VTDWTGLLRETAETVPHLALEEHASATRTVVPHGRVHHARRAYCFALAARVLPRLADDHAWHRCWRIEQARNLDALMPGIDALRAALCKEEEGT